MIDVYEQGDLNEIFERILWRGIEADHAPGETIILKDYPDLETVIERQRHGNRKRAGRGGSLLATLRTYCRRDWLKTVAPNLQRNGSLQQSASSLNHSDLANGDSEPELLRSFHFVACGIDVF